MTNQDTLKGRALADKLGAVLKALDEIEARSGETLHDSRGEVLELIERLADDAAQEARKEFLQSFNLEKST